MDGVTCKGWGIDIEEGFSSHVRHVVLFFVLLLVPERKKKN